MIFSVIRVYHFTRERRPTSFVAGGAFERVRLLPDVERAGERLPGAARKHQDRLSQGARQGKAAGDKRGHTSQWQN